MKTIRQLCAVVALICVFSLATFAGQMDTMIAQPPPPSATADGQMSTTVAGQIETTRSLFNPIDPITQIALSLLQSVLPLF